MKPNIEVIFFSTETVQTTSCPASCNCLCSCTLPSFSTKSCKMDRKSFGNTSTSKEGTLVARSTSHRSFFRMVTPPCNKFRGTVFTSRNLVRIKLFNTRNPLLSGLGCFLRSKASSRWCGSVSWVRQALLARQHGLRRDEAQCVLSATWCGRLVSG